MVSGSGSGLASCMLVWSLEGASYLARFDHFSLEHFTNVYSSLPVFSNLDHFDLGLSMKTASSQVFLMVYDNNTQKGK